MTEHFWNSSPALLGTTWCTYASVVPQTNGDSMVSFQWLHGNTWPLQGIAGPVQPSSHLANGSRHCYLVHLVIQWRNDETGRAGSRSLNKFEQWFQEGIKQSSSYHVCRLTTPTTTTTTTTSSLTTTSQNQPFTYNSCLSPAVPGSSPTLWLPASVLPGRHFLMALRCFITCMTPERRWSITEI